MDDPKPILKRLKAGAEVYACGGYLAQLCTIKRLMIYRRLCNERLDRKNKDIRQVYEDSFENWNQTFYSMVLKFLGAPNNSRAFEKLSHTVEFRIVLQYCRQPKSIEALLIGASGLLTGCELDEYAQSLMSEFAYLSHKHEIEPMSPEEWVTTRIYPQNQPTLRLAQAAAFFSQREFAFDAMLKCRTSEDIFKLFNVSASEYWTSHFMPTCDSPAHIKRIGKFKSNILGINVVAPMQFAYGQHTCNVPLVEQAIYLLENLPAESNSKVKRWCEYGVRPQTSYDTQALIQLGDCYCNQRRCEECPVGETIIKTVDSHCKIE